MTTTTEAKILLEYWKANGGHDDRSESFRGRIGSIRPVDGYAHLIVTKAAGGALTGYGLAYDPAKGMTLTGRILTVAPWQVSSIDEVATVGDYATSAPWVSEDVAAVLGQPVGKAVRS